MQGLRAAFCAGQHVRVRDARWAVLQVEPFESTSLLKLRGIDRTNRDERWAALTAFENITGAGTPTRVRQRSRQAVIATAADACVAAARWDQCWTAATASMDLHSWQLEPAVAAVTGATRILLADGVGLGKTVQAGLIISELCARGLAERVLVLTPASIRDQWAGELSTRFGLAPVVFDQTSLAATAATLPRDVNPWSTASLIIASIDLVKRAEVRAALDTTPFDVLVIDEAHHLTPDSDRGGVASGLAARVPWVVLASATPHSGDEAAYRFLTELGGAGTEPIRVFKRTRVVDDALRRRSRLLMVTPTSGERALLEATREYARALAAKRTPGARLVGSVIARRAASSAAAVERTLSRRLMLLLPDWRLEQQPLLPWDEDGVDDEVTDAVIGAAGLNDVSREREWLQELIDLARQAQHGASKLAAIRRLLRRTKEQVIIFSEYRDVALLVAAELADVTSVAALHGGLSARQRHAVVHAFNSGSVRTLVATDAAGEGLNLQQRCRLVINVELPWTPLRVEQRTGRVDRLGQTRRVHTIHLAHRSSYEGTVIARLERRRRMAQRPAEVAVERPNPVAAAARRLALRAHYSQQFAGEGGGVYASRGRHRARVLLLFSVRLLDGVGDLVLNEVVVVRVSGSHDRFLRRRTVRALVRSPEVLATVHMEAQRRAADTQSVVTPVSLALDRRVAALLVRLAKRREPATWQGSLFDRRNERRAHHHHAQVAALREHLEHRRTSARRLRQLTVGEAHLVAAWLGTP